MATLKKLAGETVLYGLSSILGRLINWLMVPLYTYVFQEPNYPTSEYGIQTQIMGYVAILMILLTYGMETGYFRFASDKEQNKQTVYTTAMTSLLISSLIFILLTISFKQPIAESLHIADRSYIITLLGVTLAIDAYSSIPFAKLRLDSRPLRFATIKLINIGINVISNVFFFLFCPYWLAKHPDSWLQNIYHHDIGIGYVFISYLIASIITLFLLIPQLNDAKLHLNIPLFKKLTKYSLPILVVGLASVLNLNFDKIAMEELLKGNNTLGQVGEYGAAFKLGVLMTLFTQAYRYAFEPFFFSNKTALNAKKLYADAFKFFTIIGLVGFLGVMLYIDVVALLIGESYREALKIIPFILLANLFLGLYYSLSLWYKLTDKTQYGAYMAIGGCSITVILNILLVPKIGYMGAAYAFFASSLAMVIVSYFWGQRHYPIPYNMKKIISYFGFALLLFTISEYVSISSQWAKLGFRTLLLAVFLTIIVKKEPKLKSLKQITSRK